MVENTPAIRSALPDRGSAGEAITLPKDVGKQVGVSAEAAERIAPTFPAQCMSRGGRLAVKVVKDEIAAVAPTRCPNLPIVGRCGSLVIGARSSEFQRMEDRLAPSQFFKHWLKFMVGMRKDSFALYR
jgi:hypothetical protein